MVGLVVGEVGQIEFPEPVIADDRPAAPLPLEGEVGDIAILAGRRRTSVHQRTNLGARRLQGLAAQLRQLLERDALPLESRDPQDAVDCLERVLVADLARAVLAPPPARQVCRASAQIDKLGRTPALAASTMNGPEGSLPPRNEQKTPSAAENIPISPAIHNIRCRRSVIR